MPRPSTRLDRLGTYVFLELARRRDAARARGVDVVDLTVGDPNGPVPSCALESAKAALDGPVHGYPPFRGHPELLAAVQRWYRRRFGVELDPAREILPLLGSKEGLYHLMQAYLDPGDAVLVPTPCYPAYLGAARLCGAEIVEVPLRAEHDFRLRCEDIDPQAARAAKLLLVNYPHNPTGAVVTRQDQAELVAFAREFDLLLVSDLPYADLALDDGPPPASLLELPGARECTVEMQSLSKSHSMAGWRVGFALGNADAIAALAKVKSNADFGIFPALQLGAAAALDRGDEGIARTRALYRARRDALCAGLRSIGWPVRAPRAGMYLWAEVPAAHGDDLRFVDELFEATGVLLTPGRAFGRGGEGWVRASLVVDPPRCEEVVRRIADRGLIGR